MTRYCKPKETVLKRTDKATHVLLLCASEGEAQKWRERITRGMKDIDPSWSCFVAHTSGIREAQVHIEGNLDLEVVFVASDYVGARSREQCLEEAVILAETLADHSHKPTVHLYGDVEYLEGFFQVVSVPVAYGAVEEVILLRWRQQAGEAVAA